MNSRESLTYSSKVAKEHIHKRIEQIIMVFLNSEALGSPAFEDRSSFRSGFRSRFWNGFGSGFRSGFRPEQVPGQVPERDPALEERERGLERESR